MYAKQKTEVIPCVPGAFPGGLTRTRFYDGMLLTQTHLEREQQYWMMKRKLTNRALGTGVVWGLRLEWDAARHKFQLAPGYAIDCCGNDLVVECPQEITEQNLLDKHDPLLQELLSGQKGNGLNCPKPETDEPVKLGLILKYTECAGDPLPVYEDDCTSNVTHCEYSSVRESVQLCLVPPPVPPEATPIDNFCEKLEAISNECLQMKDCHLFDREELLETDAFPVYIEVRNLTQNTQSLRIQPAAGEDVSESVGIVLPDPTDQIQVVVKPAPGNVIISGEVVGHSDITLAPFGGTFEVTGAQFLAAAGTTISINDLEVSSLLTNDTQLSADLSLGMGTDADGLEFLRVTTTDFKQIPTDATCNDKLSPWLIFNTSPECTLKTLALVALCGWFKGLLDDDPDAQVGGKHVLAWWVCYIAWKILFDANANDNKSSVLFDALQELLDEWCAAFIYPGPYCLNPHHGVYLGCIEVSAKGAVLSFDQWTFRRYVLTGPLLTHWGSLVGLAPVDVVAGRFASWICCIGKTSTVSITGDIAARLIDGLPLNSSGRTIVAGDQSAVSAYVEKYHLEADLDDVQTMSLDQFISRMFGEMFNGKSLNVFGGSVNTKRGFETAVSNRRKVYEIENTGLFLLEPSFSIDPFKPAVEVSANELNHLLETRTATLRPIARGLVNDYTLEVSRSIDLDRLKASSDDTVMSALINELEKHNISTVEDYLKVGPTYAAKVAMVNFEEMDEIEEKRDLYIAAENLAIASEEVLDLVVQPFAEDKIDTAGGPLLGDTLANADTAKVVGRNIRSSLKANTLTNAALKSIGGTVADRNDLVLDRSRE